MWKASRYLSCICLTLGLMLSTGSYAQFGNEWIDFTQSYYQLKIVNRDFYRVTQAELSAVGFPIASVPASRIQLFRNGQEVAINVNSNGDGTLNYLEFYGLPNDGTTDTELYDAGDQPHTRYNLFSDTTTYFLTYKLGNENGNRIAFSSDNDASGLTAEPFHLEEDIQVYFSSYAPGIKFGSGASFSLSKYDDGEGWTGVFQNKAGFTNHDFVLENFTGSQDPICDYVLTGGNSLSHNAAISVGPDAATLTQVKSTTFEGWGSTSDSFVVPSANLGSGGELTVQVLREGFPDLSERFSVSFMRITYPQSITVGSAENKVFTLANPTTTSAFLQISTTNAAGTSVYDVNDPFNPIRVATTNFSNRVEAVIPNFVDNHQVLATASQASVPVIQPVTFTEPDLVNSNFLIITHPLLRANGDPVNDYKTYRESTAGGSNQVEIIDIDDLYDLFGYGNPTPLALTRCIQYAASVGALEYVFLIGKGFDVESNYYRGTQTEVNVPTYGLPGGDMMYSLGVNTTASLPGIPIGRLNAFNTSDVTDYLNKIIEMEALAFDDLWRKDFIQLSGGITQSELSAFSSFIQDFTDVLETDFIGGRAFNTGKQTSETVEFVNVADRVNQGVGYITFFGHSSGAITDIEIGRVSNPEFGFQNEGRYPVFLVNGCNAGDIYSDNFTFGEDWMITPDLGAVGFIAHADFASASTLKRWSDLFYEVGFADENFIAESVGNIMIEVASRYLSQFGSSSFSLTQIQQMLYQGDPSYKLFGASSPDYQIDDTSLSAEGLNSAEVLATEDTFKLNIIIKNFGRSVTDSLVVQVDRTLSNGTFLTYVDQFQRTLRQDTLEFLIPNDPSQNNSGQNILTVTLDPVNSTPELNETNNTATIEVSIFNGNTTNLLPIDDATLPDETVELVWQSSNLLEQERSFDMEVDTDPSFSTSNRRTFTVSAQVIGRQLIDLASFNFPDSTTIYWRTRFSDPEPNEMNEWVTSSFTLIPTITQGWGQYEPGQLDNATVTGIEYNTLSGNWEFIQSTTPVSITTFGTDHPSLVYSDIEAIIGGIDFMVTSNTLDPTCKQNTLNAIAFDKESGDPYVPFEADNIDVFNGEVCGRLPQRIYNFEEADLITDGRLQFLIDNMRDGDPIILYSIGSVAYSNLGPIQTTLNSLGISTDVTTLTDGQPVIFFGKKGDAPGTAIEIINDGTPTPITQQSIQLSDNVQGSFTSGAIKTSRIGPALDWLSYSFNINEEVNDTYALRVLGVDQNGVATSLPTFERSRAETIDVSTIDENTYPSLALEFTFEDETNLTPPQLNFWEINYLLPPEGIVQPTNTSVSSFQEGQTIERSFFFYNLSSLDFQDSLMVEVTLVNNSGSTQSNNFQIAPPIAGDSTSFTASFGSFGFDGQNSIVVNVTPGENEMYDFNNRLTLTNLVEVQADQTNPVLDVTFDGSQILDGDIVSPNPNILIRMRDDNPFIFKNDTSGFNISLKLPGEASVFQRVSFSSPQLSFTEATESQDFEVSYQPGPLGDGIYGLRVQAADEAGNQAGTEPYEINFEVINESSITHFYPYPNPFSTSCRFVFTLTGSEIPDQIKIQIMTVSGRIVREITQDEIGTIRIGNNITEYAWDGRDEFGDQLANGVYFYRVFVNSNGQSLERRTTSADRAFKNGFGKLYILR